MQTTQIGNLHWCTENLNVRHFRNGDQIPLATSLREVLNYAAHQQPCCCYYNFDDSNKMYGLLYNWYAVYDGREIAPEGFRVANHFDVEVMFEELKNLNLQQYEYNILEKNVLFQQSQFNPTPTGYLSIEEEENADFEDLHKYAWYWTSSPISFSEQEDWAPVYNFHNENWNEGFYEAMLYAYNHEASEEAKGSMLAVRCVKTETGNSSIADQLDDLLSGLTF